MTTDVIDFPTDQITPYKKNARTHSDLQIERLGTSIKQFGFNQPIVIDEFRTVLVGHGRLLAAKMLKLETVPVVMLSGLSEAQKKAYRILDNKLQNDSAWDLELLDAELKDLIDSDFDLSFGGLDELAGLITDQSGENNSGGESEGAYSGKIKSPVYTPTLDEQPPTSALYDASKYQALTSAITGAENIPPEVRRFLTFAATRHIVFDYQTIAEYYAHAPKEVQLLMEQSALIIIDFEKAIEGGFVKMTTDLASLYSASKELYGEEESLEDDSSASE